MHTIFAVLHVEVQKVVSESLAAVVWLQVLPAKLVSWLESFLLVAGTEQNGTPWDKVEVLHFTKSNKLSQSQRESYLHSYRQTQTTIHSPFSSPLLS